MYVHILCVFDVKRDWKLKKNQNGVSIKDIRSSTMYTFKVIHYIIL